MITSPDVFDEDWIPQRLLHRDAEVQALTRAWAPVRDRREADDVLIAGPSGVGKTVLTRFVGDRVEDETAVKTAQIRCLGLTAPDILRTVLQETTSTGARDAGLAELENDLRQSIDTPTIVVLDEGDHVPPAAIATLRDCPDISIVSIVHDRDQWLAELNRDRQRWTPDTEIALDRYAVDELVDILGPRRTQGLAPGTITTDQLREIADQVAGVAREGIQTLRASAEVALERGHDSVREADIEMGHERAVRRIRKTALESLPWHHHVLYALIYDAGVIEAAALHDRYDDLAEECYADRKCQPIGRRARRTKLRKLAEYGLIERSGERQKRHYSTTDQSIAPPVQSVFSPGE